MVGRLEEKIGMEVVGNLEVFLKELYLVDHMWGAGEIPLGDWALWQSIGLMWEVPGEWS